MYISDIHSLFKTSHKKSGNELK